MIFWVRSGVSTAHPRHTWTSAYPALFPVLTLIVFAIITYNPVLTRVGPVWIDVIISLCKMCLHIRLSSTFTILTSLDNGNFIIRVVAMPIADAGCSVECNELVSPSSSLNLHDNWDFFSKSATPTIVPDHCPFVGSIVSLLLSYQPSRHVFGAL